MYRNTPCRVTPRLAYYLWFELGRIAALWNAELERGTDLGTSDLVRCLPRIAQLHATTDFLKRIVNATQALLRRH